MAEMNECQPRLSSAMATHRLPLLPWKKGISSRACSQSECAGTDERRDTILPLPPGEGRGEGNRALKPRRYAKHQAGLAPVTRRLLAASVLSCAFAANLLCGAESKELTNSIGLKLVRIEPGTFTMGQDGPAADYKVKAHAAKFDDADWDEKPVHRVTISTAFHLGATEVTRGQYRRFNPKHHDGNGAEDDAVTDVSWHDAVKFCAWLSAREKLIYRLPTEAEWEYACRAGTTTLFHTGDALPAGFHRWTTDLGLRDRFFPGGRLPPEFRPDANPSLRVAQTPANAWGLFDMHGNVSEWCADWYGPYEAGEQTDPLGRSDGDFRVIRGGSHSVQTRLLRSANRTAWLPDTR